MKVVYTDGHEGILSGNDSKNLFIKERFTKESWEELEKEMLKLNITKFEDPLLSEINQKAKLNSTYVTLDYVKAQVSAH